MWSCEQLCFKKCIIIIISSDFFLFVLTAFNKTCTKKKRRSDQLAVRENEQEIHTETMQIQVNACLLPWRTGASVALGAGMVVSSNS
jgi:hypothetical protein